MGRYASDSGSGNFTPAPVGTHIGRCFSIIDLGTQHSEYQGKPTRRNQILVSWELPDELVNDKDEMKPVTISKFYTNSLGERANLRKDLESWRGKSFTEEELNGFDLEHILGKPCMLTVVGTENGKTKVASVTGLPKNTTCPDQINSDFSFWLDEYSQQKFDSLSDGIKEMIKKSEEWPKINNGTPIQSAPATNFSDTEDIPF